MKTLQKLFSFLLCIALLLSQSGFSLPSKSEKLISKDNLLAALYESDIQAIQEAYKAGLLTCYDVTEYYLQRISTYNESYNCFITLCTDALDRAKEIDSLMASGVGEGLLLGIPIVIKDNMNLAGYHTTNGHVKSSDQIAKSNAEIVDYLLQQGAVIIGKTNMSTDAQDAYISASNAVGETKNAYGLYLSSGGSSGGSAVATSLNFAVAGLGTDTNSSLRLPAVLNGCISLRVTWDTLSTEGIIKLNRWRDVPGVITRSVMDQAIVLDVLSAGQTSYAENLNPEALSGLRLGIIKELTYLSGSSVDKEVIETFETAVQELESCGAEIVQVSVPGVNYWYEEYDDSSSFRKKALSQLEAVMEEANISAVIFPSYLNAPLYSGRDEQGVYHNPYDQPFLNNCRRLSTNLGIPEIALPIGYHSRGAGIGMEIAAGKNQEQLLLDITYSYTLAYDHRQAPHKAEDLYSNSYNGSLRELVELYYQFLEETNNEDTSTEPVSEEVQADSTQAPTESSEDIRPTETEPITTIVTEVEISSEGKIFPPTQLLFLAFLLLAALVPIFLLIVFIKRRKQKKQNSKDSASRIM